MWLHRLSKRRTAANVADKVLFVPAAVYRGKDEVVPSFQPMGNLFEQCLLITFDMIVMTIVDETPELTFEKMSKRIATWSSVQ